METREILEQAINNHQEAIDKARAELKLLDKPVRPRPGSYGEAPGGMRDNGPHFVLFDNESGYWRNAEGMRSCHWNSHDGENVKKRGNIFDDFKRNQGGLRQFTLANDSTKSIKVKWISCDSHVEITQPSISWSGQGAR